MFYILKLCINLKGPSTDVSGSGFYIYLETSGVIKGHKARLISPKINDTMAKGTHCLQFYYNLYGDEVNCIINLLLLFLNKVLT
jgi:hypothetical protein